MNVAAAWPTFVDQSAGEAGCWPWTRARHSNGYGQFRENSCDNPPCCNPGHLLVGTQAENLRDMAVRGRVGTARLTASDVAEIKRLRFRHRQCDLAARFAVDRSTIAGIVAGRSWTHVTVDPLCAIEGCERTPRPNNAICDSDVLDLVAPAPRPAQQPDLADPPLGAIASRDGAAGSPEAPCPAASRHADARKPRGPGAGAVIHGASRGASPRPSTGVPPAPPPA